MNVSIIISYRKTDEYRERSLNLIIQYLKVVLDEAELIVIEHDAVSHFNNI